MPSIEIQRDGTGEHGLSEQGPGGGLVERARAAGAGARARCDTWWQQGCGWIDLVALKYTIMLSGVTRLIVTKADVMDGFDTIKAATAYKIGDVVTAQMPFDICEADIEAQYESFKGWAPVKTSECTTIESLPAEFKNFCTFIENYLEVKIQYVSNGTGRDNLLKLF